MRWYWLALTAAIVLILLDWEWAYFSNCHFTSPDNQGDYANKYYCLPQTLTWRTLGFVADQHAIIAAAATAVIAWFTVVLVNATRQLGELSRQQTSDAQISQRAYVWVDGRGVYPLVAGATNGLGNSITEIAVKNVGRLPARDVKWFIDAAIDHGRRSEFGINEDQFYPVEGRLVLAPGTIMMRSHRAIFSQEHIDAFQQKDIGPHLYVWGEIRYTDGFGMPRRTKFCHRYPPGTLRKIASRHPHGGRPYVPADRMRYHQFGNDAD